MPAPPPLPLKEALTRDDFKDLISLNLVIFGEIKSFFFDENITSKNNFKAEVISQSLEISHLPICIQRNGGRGVIL